MFTINQNSPISISKQIYDTFKKLILTGALSEGEQLPSVRTVAKDLMINPNTVHKVYQELLADELVKSVPQKGLYVNKITENLKAEYLNELEKNFKLSYRNLLDMKLTKDEILKLID